MRVDLRDGLRIRNRDLRWRDSNQFPVFLVLKIERPYLKVFDGMGIPGGFA